MKDFLGIALLGVGAYVLYEYFYGTPSTTAMATPTVPPSVTTANSTQNTTVGSTTGNQAGQNNQPNVSQSQLMAMVLAAAQQNSIMQQQSAANGGNWVGSASQWNYILQQVLGTESPLVDYPGDTGGNISIQTYFSWRQNAGLSGLDREGLGRVYMSGWGGRGFHGLGSFYMAPNFPTGLTNESYINTFGLGEVGAGYGINQNRINAGASYYELADKRLM